MREPTELEQQQYERFRELFALSRQRYLQSGGDPLRSADGRYLTDQERQEFIKIGRLIFGVHIKDGYVYCQGRSWKLPDKEVAIQESEATNQ